MEIFIQIAIFVAGAFSGLSDVFFAAVSDGGILLPAGGAVTLAFAAAITYSDIPAEVLAVVRRWHGSIDEQFGNIDNLVVNIQGHTAWGTPSVFSQIVTNRSLLATLIPKCRSPLGSPAERGQRSILLKMTVGMCLAQVRAWAYMKYYDGVLTINDVHTLGFLLPGEMGGHRDRTEAIDVLAEVKASIINADVICAIIDQSVDKNAALVAHGWPSGVRQALIVITASDGVTEVVRRMTTSLHTDIQMPEGSHGKQFLIKASFLRHIDDQPRFGPQPTFSMPLTTEDLIATLDRQQHEEFEAHIRTIERHRLETEPLTARNPATE
jgi:hypothetical protein